MTYIKGEVQPYVTSCHAFIQGIDFTFKVWRRYVPPQSVHYRPRCGEVSHLRLGRDVKRKGGWGRCGATPHLAARLGHTVGLGGGHIGAHPAEQRDDGRMSPASREPNSRVEARGIGTAGVEGSRAEGLSSGVGSSHFGGEMDGGACPVRVPEVGLARGAR